MSLTQTRPVAILLGWLGCRPQSLRRYVQLYDSNGWDSIIRVATPEAVVAAVARGPSVMQQDEWRKHSTALPWDTHDRGEEMSTKDLQQFALEILCELQTRQCPRFVVHIFSNGGCFLWEWIRYYLFKQQQQHVTWKASNIDVHNLQQRLVGRVFDSAPAHYGGKSNGIESALEHITPITERNRLIALAKKLDASDVKVRHDEFWKNLLHDPLAVPELYLYSEKDHLTAHEPLQMLIDKRRSIVGQQNMWTHNFRDSEHCCHMLKYPEQYEAVLEKFLVCCSNHVHEITAESRSESGVTSKM